MVFMAWCMHVAMVNAAALAAENKRLRAKLGKRANSIWEMNNADLVEIARTELGMTIAAAERETAITLREKIGANRAKTKMNQDPTLVIPKGLDSVTHLELQEELQRRHLPIPMKATRPQMILAIREQIAYVLGMTVTNPEVSQTNGSASQSSNVNTSAEAEWMKVDSVGDRSTRKKG